MRKITMPAPIIAFTKEMKKDERSKALTKIKDEVIECKEISNNKKAVLKQIVNYAENNLINEGFFTSTNPQRIVVCGNIFTQVNLPDLLFLQYAYNQLSSIRNTNSKLRDDVLPTVKMYRDAHLYIVTEQMQNIAIGLGLISVFVWRDEKIMLAAAFMFILSPYLAQARVDAQLNSQSARQITNNAEGRLEDGWDEIVLNASGLGGRALRATARGALSFYENHVRRIESRSNQSSISEQKFIAQKK